MARELKFLAMNLKEKKKKKKRKKKKKKWKIYIHVTASFLLYAVDKINSTIKIPSNKSEKTSVACYACSSVQRSDNDTKASNETAAALLLFFFIPFFCILIYIMEPSGAFDFLGQQESLLAAREELPRLGRSNEIETRFVVSSLQERERER